ncbi:hypothetical protein NGR_c24270 [Sinorhizobium fredii NGR234]|uniref:Uncharacterized protein n=1 Tax=Sinorhizobium fredii (strain NBRC 101917 / NGR234) TaxID=394 RepID=C3MGB2_SINFN|nr:hypothetical protein [Sinorhizobium fredii]ACP26184.1 hypothetical protein NGR_c24270 [Sinorhizobium fredii NGR234]
MTAKIRIKAGPVEFEYEGETELGVADIKELFSHIETLFKVPVLAEGGEGSHTPHHEQPVPRSNGYSQKLHINSVASKLKAKSGSEVALAAAATLQIFEGKETFTRGELLDTMKKATMHYKESMSGNLTKALGTLIGSKFNQISDGVYSLNIDAFTELEAQLA